MPRAGVEDLERGRGWGGAPKGGWARQGPWAMGEEKAGTARQSLRNCPFGVGGESLRAGGAGRIEIGCWRKSTG